MPISSSARRGPQVSLSPSEADAAVQRKALHQLAPHRDAFHVRKAGFEMMDIDGTDRMLPFVELGPSKNKWLVDLDRAFRVGKFDGPFRSQWQIASNHFLLTIKLEQAIVPPHSIIFDLNKHASLLQAAYNATQLWVWLPGCDSFVAIEVQHNDILCQALEGGAL